MDTILGFVDYSTDYKINRDGTIVSLKKMNFGNQMKTRKDSDGYVVINLCKDGIKRTEKVARLVGHLYVPNPDNLPEINHEDGNKENNNDWNLKWTDRAGNVSHAYKKGLRRSRKGEYNKPNKKLLQLNIQGEKVNEFGSYVEAERRTGIANSYISICVNTPKTAGGYLWKIAS